MGGDLLQSDHIKEEDEQTTNFLTELCKESDIQFMKNEMKGNQYPYILNAFRVLQGKEKQLQIAGGDIELWKEQNVAF